MKTRKLKFRTLLKHSLSLIMILSFTQISNAQQTNFIKLSYISQKRIALDYERVMGEKTSLLVGLKYYDMDYNSFDFISESNDDHYNKGLRLNGEYRYYFYKDQPQHGLYVAPSISIGGHQLDFTTPDFEHILVELPDGTSMYNTIFYEDIKGDEFVIAGGLGLKLGYQARINRFTWDFGAQVAANTTFNGKKGFSLNNGAINQYQGDIKGRSLEIFTGIGIAF